eukprot:6211030-Pyramimonas_sp.AAC.1
MWPFLLVDFRWALYSGGPSPFVEGTPSPGPRPADEERGRGMGGGERYEQGSKQKVTALKESALYGMANPDRRG